MKKLFYILICVLSTIGLTPMNMSAAVNLPKTISIGGVSSYDAGVEVRISSVYGSESIGEMTDIEYGVAEAYTEGYSTSYRIISTQSKSLKDITSLEDVSLKMPNMYEGASSNTYVVYVKYFEKNNPDKKKFFFTDTFTINKNNTPFTRIKNINLVHSNGNIFELLYGPTIYSPDFVNKNRDENLATSTSLNITFESNQNVEVNPVITFSRLRSDADTEVIQSEQLQIKKGETSITIPLSTFEYIPGVYVGKITFMEDFIKNDFNFQYIVGGGSVTVGMVEVVESDNMLKFNIFDTPIDLERSYMSADSVLSTSSLYTVTGTFLNSNGGVSGNFTKEVDFTKENFTVHIPQKIFSDTEIRDINIKVISKDGTVVFESAKKIQYTQTSRINLINSIIYVLFFILLIIVLTKKNIKLITIFSIVILLVLFGVYYKIYGFSNLPAPVLDNRAQGGHGIGKQVVLTTEDDLYTKKFPCGQPVQINYEFKLQTCNNLPSTGSYNISFAGGLVASKNTGSVKLSTMDLGVSTLKYPASVVPPTLVADTSLVVHTHIANSNPRRYVDVTASTMGYNIKLQNTCEDTSPTCLCSGRTEVCTLAGTEVSRNINATSCALKASCSASVSGTSAIFNTIANNAFGVISYKDTDTGLLISNPYTKTGSAGSVVVQKTTITDLFDGMTASSVCSVTVSSDNLPTSVCVAGVANCSSSGSSTNKIPPTVKKFKATQNPVQKGGLCEYTWLAENANRCTLIVNGTSLNIQSISGSVSLSTMNGLNQKGVLTCVSDSLLPAGNATISTTTLCNVLPEVIER